LVNLLIPVANRFASNPQEQPQSPRSGLTLESVAKNQFRKTGMVPPYIESECIALMAVVIRLNVASECEKELTRIAEKTWPDFDSLMTQSGAREMRTPAQYWPYKINTADEPWRNISAETWAGWAIHRTLFEHFGKKKEDLPLLGDLLNRTQLRLSFRQADRNNDGQFSKEEFTHPDADSVDINKDGSLDFEEYCALYAKLVEAREAQNTELLKEPERVSDQTMSEWVSRQIAKYDLNKDGKLTTNEWTRMLVPPVDADTNGDGEITVEEYTKFRER
jgi:hypothetical protein